MYVGIDAGGTRTRLVLVDCQGARLTQVEGGPGNYQMLGGVALADLIAELVLKAKPASTPAVLCAGVAGAGRESEQRSLLQLLDDRHVARRCIVVSDARAALEGAHGGRAGVVCIAGTGSMVLGTDDNGDEARAGGWGPVLGDEGSAYWIVIEGIRRVLQAADGSGAQTRLQAELLPALGLQGPDELITAIYGGTLSRERISAACPIIFSVARDGDESAMDVVRAGGRALGAQIAAVSARLGLVQPVPVACSGGVFAELDALGPYMQDGAGTCQLGLRRPQLPAVLGAALLALRADQLELPPAVLAAWTADPS